MADKLLCAAKGLRDALYVKMAECDAKPCRISLSPTSATPIDVCCDCGDGDGQAWVSIINAVPKFSEASGFTPCGFETEFLFVIGISRCSPSIDDLGNPPSAEDLNEATEKVTLDFQIMRAAIALYVTEEDVDKQMYRYGRYDVHPVRGGCQVSTHELYLNLGVCSPC
jgi:hypothetical protein